MKQISQVYIDQIIELAREAELEDPIDWGMISIDELDTYQFVASNVIETFLDKYKQPNSREMMLAVIVKLVVENLVLNVKLREKQW